MIVRAIDLNGDWTFGQGKQNYLSGIAAIAQEIKTRIQSFLGDCFFDITAGIDWFTFLSSKDQLGLNLAISSVILNTAGVTGLLQLSVNLTSERSFSVSYKVQTTYSVTGTTFEYDIA